MKNITNESLGEYFHQAGGLIDRALSAGPEATERNIHACQMAVLESLERAPPAERFSITFNGCLAQFLFARALIAAIRQLPEPQQEAIMLHASVQHLEMCVDGMKNLNAHLKGESNG